MVIRATRRIIPQPIPPRKRGLKIKYKYRQAHHDESQDIEVNDGKSQPKSDQPQADAPANPEEDLKDNLDELEDLDVLEELIEPEKNPLKRTYQDTLTQL